MSLVKKFNTQTHERVKVAKQILAEMLPTSAKHFGQPVSQYLHSSIIRVPLKSGAPRNAIGLAVEEFAMQDNKPMVVRDDVEVGATRPVSVQSPMAPQRRRRNNILRRGLAYFQKFHEDLKVKTCHGTGSLKLGERPLLKANYEGHVVYYAPLRKHHVDKNALENWIKDLRNSVAQEPEY